MYGFKWSDLQIYPLLTLYKDVKPRSMLCVSVARKSTVSHLFVLAMGNSLPVFSGERRKEYVRILCI